MLCCAGLCGAVRCTVLFSVVCCDVILLYLLQTFGNLIITEMQKIKKIKSWGSPRSSLMHFSMLAILYRTKTAQVWWKWHALHAQRSCAETIPHSRGRRRQRRQNNKTNYRRQKAHVNMWNKADICAVLLSNETSTAPFPRCLQNVADISRTNAHRFVQEETLESTGFRRK